MQKYPEPKAILFSQYNFVSYSIKSRLLLIKVLAGHCGFIEHNSQLSFLLRPFKLIEESISIVITGKMDNNG